MSVPVWKNPDGARLQELLVQLWDKDDSDDDFLGEASLLLGWCFPAAAPVYVALTARASGNLIADPKRAHTLPLAVPGRS